MVVEDQERERRSVEVPLPWPPKLWVKSLIITECWWEASQGAGTSPAGTRNAERGVGRNGSGRRFPLSHGGALVSAPVQLAPWIWGSQLTKVQKKWCRGSIFSEVERWDVDEWNGLCALQVWWRSGREREGQGRLRGEFFFWDKGDVSEFTVQGRKKRPTGLLMGRQRDS